MTRKQQIISRFPKDWKILFLEPHKAGKKMNLAPVWHDNVCIVTVPLFFKNFKPKLIKWLLNFKIVRGFLLLLSWLWIKEIIRRTGFQSPDLIAASNIYAAPFVKRLCTGLPVLYDMNDNHLAFPNTPRWAGDYYRSLCVSANQIVLAHEGMKELLPAKGRFGNHIVTNGVDYSLFTKERKIILYVGTISEWIDIELLERIAKAFPDAILRLVGPEAVNVDGLKSLPNVELVGSLDRRLTVEQIKRADACLVPFKDCKLTRHITHINKIFEYLAAGKPVVSIGRPKTDEELRNPNLVYTAQSHEEFIFYLRTLIYRDDKRNVKARQRFAEANDWNRKAIEMTEIIKQMVSN
jgi:glycosyltransferase involved in cell wall biosynthesis